MEWAIDPEIFNITILGFNLAPRYYGLAFVMGFFFGERYASKYLIANGYTKEEVSSLFTHMLSGCIIGARLGHCLLYEPSYYLANPLSILKVWEGGLASHGGFLGVMIGVWLFNRKVKMKLDYIWLLDLVAAPSLITGAYIRLGNLMNSEILGTPTDLPWGVVFKRVDNISRHPAQLYEAIGYLVISLIVFRLYKKNAQVWIRGRFIGIILIAGMSWRFFTEHFKENQVPFEEGMFLNMGQILSLLMIGVGAYLAFREKLGKSQN